jgi:hypothetical protein
MSPCNSALAIVLSLGLFATTPLPAGDLLNLHLSHEDGVYRLSADVVIDAPATAVHDRLTDYANLTALNPSILRSEVLEAPATFDARVRTLIKACVLVYCQTLKRVEDVRASPDQLLAVIVPEQGNFSAGRTQWLLEPRGTQVLVRYRAELVPDFTLPPVIGTTLVRQALARELRTVLERLQRLAQSSSPPLRG